MAAVTLMIFVRSFGFISNVYILFTARSQARSSHREHPVKSSNGGLTKSAFNRAGKGFFSLSFLLSGQKG
jgi:hypothetical protein